MDAGTLHDAIAEVCPVASTTVGKADDRATWSFVPEDDATTEQVLAGENVIATIPINPLATALPTGDFIARWSNAEYKALNKKKTQTLKSSLVTDGILTQARADEIFS